ncbi:MAG: hypothetical protein J0I36_07970, partial [Pandoraea sp.]|nr:hypothetical protein [Pandoraea sp.]
MPELPEVEVTRRGIAPHVAGTRVARIDVRNASLRWPVPDGLDADYSSATSPHLKYGEWSYRAALSYQPTEEAHYYV